MTKRLKDFKYPLILAVIMLLLTFFRQDTAADSFSVMMNYTKEILLIMPPVFILMGLMEVWMPKDRIEGLLGRESGIKGALLSFALGTLPTGPLYAAFPLTASLIKKGASYFNMVIFLGTWAALKVPQLIVEIKFLGIPFTVSRFILTLAGLTAAGIVIQFLMDKNTGHEIPVNKNENN